MNGNSRNESGPSTPEAKHWENYWSGGRGPEDGPGAAVTGAARSEAIQETWRGFFEQVNERLKHGSAALRFTDLACGAGVVTENAVSALAPDHLARTSLVGLDYSVSAARQYSAKFRTVGAASVAGVVADAHVLPFPAASIDIAVSQFGLEYAGGAAVAEAGRLIAPDGAILCLTHYRAGAIERECSENFEIANGILDSGSFHHVRNLFANPGDGGAEEQAKSALESLRKFAEANSVSAGQQLLARTRKDLLRLVLRRTAFAPQEAVAWLDASASELSMYAGRMRSMLDAALGEDQIRSITAQWSAAGLSVEAPAPVVMDKADAPSAWRLQARRAGE